MATDTEEPKTVQSRSTSEETIFNKKIEKLREVIPTLEELGHIKSDKGIMTGKVVVCGRRIPPPYDFSYDVKEFKVLMNGIQVHPPNPISKLCNIRLTNATSLVFLFSLQARIALHFRRYALFIHSFGGNHEP